MAQTSTPNSTAGLNWWKMDAGTGPRVKLIKMKKPARRCHPTTFSSILVLRRSTTSPSLCWRLFSKPEPSNPSPTTTKTGKFALTTTVGQTWRHGDLGTTCEIRWHNFFRRLLSSLRQEGVICNLCRIPLMMIQSRHQRSELKSRERCLESRAEPKMTSGLLS
jgi:hypothetical protein